MLGCMSKQNIPRRRFMILLDEDVYERLRWLAFTNRRPVSVEAREVIRAAVASVENPAEGEATS